MPSTSSYATNNILLPKKSQADGTEAVIIVTFDFRVLITVTREVEYPTKDVKTIVRWLAMKRLYSVADRRDG